MLALDRPRRPPRRPGAPRRLRPAERVGVLPGDGRSCSGARRRPPRPRAPPGHPAGPRSAARPLGAAPTGRARVPGPGWTRPTNTGLGSGPRSPEAATADPVAGLRPTPPKLRAVPNGCPCRLAGTGSPRVLRCAVFGDGGGTARVPAGRVLRRGARFQGLPRPPGGPAAPGPRGRAGRAGRSWRLPVPVRYRLSRAPNITMPRSTATSTSASSATAATQRQRAPARAAQTRRPR